MLKYNIPIKTAKNQAKKYIKAQIYQFIANLFGYSRIYERGYCAPARLLGFAPLILTSRLPAGRQARRLFSSLPFLSSN